MIDIDILKKLNMSEDDFLKMVSEAQKESGIKNPSKFKESADESLDYTKALMKKTKRKKKKRQRDIRKSRLNNFSRFKRDRRNKNLKQWRAEFISKSMERLRQINSTSMRINDVQWRML